MKKVLAMVLALTFVLTFAAGCKKKEVAGSDVQMKDGNTVQTVVEQIVNEVGVAMPADIDDTVLKDLLYINPDDVLEYAGKFAMVNTSADHIIGIAAKDGKIDAVKEGLEKRLEDTHNAFEFYLPEQKSKTEKGQVIVKGNYAFLLILGESEETFDADMEKAVKIVNDAF